MRERRSRPLTLGDEAPLDDGFGHESMGEIKGEATVARLLSPEGVGKVG